MFNFNKLVSDLDIEICTLTPETVRTLNMICISGCGSCYRRQSENHF